MIAGLSSVWKFKILNFIHFKKFLIIYFSYSAYKKKTLTHFFGLVNMEVNFYFHGFYITNTCNSEAEKLKPKCKRLILV